MKVKDIIMKKAVTLEDIRTVCAYFPLNRDDYKQFYVDTTEARGSNMLKRLKYLFGYVPDGYQQVVYFGHSGSGKSTILYQLKLQLHDAYKVICYSVQDDLNMGDMSLVDLLFSIYEHIYLTYKDQFTDSHTKLLQKIYSLWYGVQSTEITEIKTSSTSIEGDIKISLKVLFAYFKNIFQADTIRRKTIRVSVSNKIGEYIQTLNELVKKCEDISGKPILVMIEDIEKVLNKEDAKSIFVDFGMFFRDMKLRLLLTAPIFLKYTEDVTNSLTNYFTSLEECPTIKIAERDGSDFGEGIETLRKIIYARVEESLIDRDALTLAVKNTGGLIRDLLDIIMNASLNCLIRSGCIIDTSDVQRAINRRQSLYLNVFSGDDKNIEVVKKIYADPDLTLSNDANFMHMVRSLIILEYCDSDEKQWRGIHPLIVSYLKNKHLLQ